MLDYVGHPNCVEISAKGYIVGVEVCAPDSMRPHQYTGLIDGEFRNVGAIYIKPGIEKFFCKYP